MTHRPSTKAWVEREPSLARRSSEISPPLAGPWAKDLVMVVGMPRERVRRRLEESILSISVGFELAVLIWMDFVAFEASHHNVCCDVTLKIGCKLSFQ